MERERINAAQREALMALYGCFSLLEVRAAELTGIAGRVKYGKRDFKMLLRVMEKLVTNTLDTLPMEQLKTVQRAVRMSCVRVSANDYTGKRGDDWLLSREELALLVNAAAERCLTCTHESGHGCELRRLIKELPVEAEPLLIPCVKD